MFRFVLSIATFAFLFAYIHANKVDKKIITESNQKNKIVWELLRSSLISLVLGFRGFWSTITLFQSLSQEIWNAGAVVLGYQKGLLVRFHSFYRRVSKKIFVNTLS